MIDSILLAAAVYAAYCGYISDGWQFFAVAVGLMVVLMVREEGEGK